MAIKKVWVEDSCIVCHLSEDTCPQVFEILPDAESARVKADVSDFGPYEEKIREAAEGCPVQAIRFEEG